MGKKRSEVWNYFIRDDTKLRAYCRYCEQSVSILGGNISNLTRHLKKKHAKISLTRLLAGEVVSFNESEEQETDAQIALPELSLGHEKTSAEGLDIVEAIDVPQVARIEKEVSALTPVTEILSIKQPPTSRKNKSDVWAHFTKYQSPDARRRIGKCHYCAKVVSASGGISNLKRHLVHKHPDVLGGASKPQESLESVEVQLQEPDQALANSSPPLPAVPSEVEVPSTVVLSVFPKSPSLRRSRIWSHFTANECNTKAKCNYCGTEISMCYGSLGNLFRHLRKKHPKVRIAKMPAGGSRPVQKLLRSELVPVSLPIRKGKKASDVWRHFTKLRNADNTRIRGECHYCKRLVSASAGSVSNLKRHLRKKHPSYFSPQDRSRLSEGESSLQKTLDSRLSVSVSPRSALKAYSARSDDFEVSVCDDYLAQSSSSPNPVILKLSAPFDSGAPLSADKKKSVDKQLAKFICKGFHHPSSFFESDTFKDLLQALNPAYELISLDDFKNSLLPKTFEETVAEVQAKLNAASGVCLSAETWTTSKDKRFGTLKAHYLVSGEPHCSVLSCSEFIDSYAPENIAVWFQSTVIEWNLESKITGIVTDDSMEMTVASEFCNWHHLPCFAYALNGIVLKGLKEVDEIVVKVRSASQHIRSSPQILNNFYDVQRQVGLQKLKLKEDNPAVWATTCKMLERFLTNRDCVMPTLMQSNYNEEEVRFLDGAWEVIDGIVKLLNLFGELVMDLSVEKLVVLSRVPILLRIIADRLDSFAGLPNEVEVMRTVIVEEFNAKFDLAKLETDQLVGSAVLLDPRFKKEGFSSEDHFSQVKDAVISELGSSTLAPPASESNDAATPSASQSSSLWVEFDKLVKQTVDESSQSPGFVTEMENYLAESLIPRTSNPLVWWNNRKAVYPTLHALVLKRLCTPASAGPFKRLFSNEGFVLTDRRFRLNSSKLVPIITFLHQNL